MSSTATHFTPILCESGDSAPEYIQILPAGSFAPNDGRGPWVLSDCGAVIAATRRALGNLDILLDYNHQSEHSAKNGRFPSLHSNATSRKTCLRWPTILPNLRRLRLISLKFRSSATSSDFPNRQREPSALAALATLMKSRSLRK